MATIAQDLWSMTALGQLSWGEALMLVLGAGLLYLGIFRQYEPLLLVPIGFGVLLANIPGGQMAVISATEHPEIAHMALPQIAADYGIMNM
ncbi:MAG: sodium ion-translocating decarboxylase subunit beta, partial [Lewinella sp.]|nr:sodium ion-translocating decarboxylase subunit beta [Lewinella sp.]